VRAPEAVMKNRWGYNQGLQIQMKHLRMTTVRVSVIAAIVPLLACCASTGVYNMTDEWCAQHLSASAARCADRQERVADHQQRIAANEVRSGE